MENTLGYKLTTVCIILRRCVQHAMLWKGWDVSCQGFGVNRHILALCSLKQHLERLGGC